MGFEAVTDKTAARAARLEIEALQELLAKLPPDQAGELKAEAIVASGSSALKSGRYNG